LLKDLRDALRQAGLTVGHGVFVGVTVAVAVGEHLISGNYPTVTQHWIEHIADAGAILSTGCVTAQMVTISGIRAYRSIMDEVKNPPERPKE